MELPVARFVREGESIPTEHGRVPLRIKPTVDTDASLIHPKSAVDIAHTKELLHVIKFEPQSQVQFHDVINRDRWAIEGAGLLLVLCQQKRSLFVKLMWFHESKLR